MVNGRKSHKVGWQTKRRRSDHAYVAAKACELRVTDTPAVDSYRARLRIVNAVQQSKRGRLAGAGRINERDGFAQFDRESERAALDSRPRGQLYPSGTAPRLR